MATYEFILAMEPEPLKQIVRIDRAKYDMVHDSILANLRVYGPMATLKLGAMVEEQLQGDFAGPLMWYYSMVKLDMEACGQIRAMPGSRPPLLEIAL